MRRGKYRRFCFLVMTIAFDATAFSIAAVVLGAYVVFGISAFGASLFMVPLLTHLFPLEVVLPLCAAIRRAPPPPARRRPSPDSATER